MAARGKKSKFQIQAAKPEMPAFLQRMKQQIVANEDQERLDRSEKRRRGQAGGSILNDDEDDPTIVKLNDGELTEAEYKRMKLELETQYKVTDEPKKRSEEEIDLDRIIRNKQALNRKDPDGSTCSRGDRQRESSSGVNRNDKRPNKLDNLTPKQKAPDDKRRVLSYSSSDDDDGD